METREDELTELQARFVECYLGEANGNATLAAKLAGYQGSDKALAVTASRLLRSAKVRRFLAKVSKGEVGRQGKAAAASVELAVAIATHDERRAWLSGVMRDPKVAMRDRLRAAELLAKIEGDFIHKVEVSGPDGGPMETLDVSKLSDEALAELDELLADGR